MADDQKKIAIFTKEEMEAVSRDLQTVLEKYDAIFHIHRVISPEGTIQAELQIVKKSALVPKEESVVSPIQSEDLNGGNEETSEKTDTTPA